MFLVVCIYQFHCLPNVLMDAVKRQSERIDRTFQTFQQIGGHEFAQAFFTAVNRQTFTIVVDTVTATGTIEEIERWGVYGKIQSIELLGNILEIDGIAQVRQTRTARQGSKPLRKLANISRVVILDDMATTTCDGHGIEHLKKVKLKT